MILVIGGYFQGKKEYVKNRFYLSDDDFSDDLYSSKPVMTNFESWKGSLGEKELELLLNKKAVISLESGCQVLSLNEKDRLLVEKVNSALQYLALNADSVIRLYCGIPKALKGEI